MWKGEKLTVIRNEVVAGWRCYRRSSEWTARQCLVRRWLILALLRRTLMPRSARNQRLPTTSNDRWMPSWSGLRSVTYPAVVFILPGRGAYTPETSSSVRCLIWSHSSTFFPVFFVLHIVNCRFLQFSCFTPGHVSCRIRRASLFGSGGSFYLQHERDDSASGTYCVAQQR